MAKLLRVPEVSANADEAILEAWVVVENAAYAATDTIATIETEKAVVEVESDADGVLLKTLVDQGATVKVGTPIAVLGDPGEVVADISALLAELGVGSAQPGPAGAGPTEEVQPDPVEAGPTDEVQPDRGLPDQPMGEAPVTEAPNPPGAEETEAQQAPAAGGDGAAEQPQSQAKPQSRVFSSPIARRLAGQAGIAVDQITGSGPNGRIIRRDVEAAISGRDQQGTATPAPGAATPAPSTATPVAGTAAPAPAAPRVPTEAQPAGGPPPPSPTYQDSPHSRLRTLIAARLTESKQTAPHFYLRGTARVDGLLDLRARLNDGRSQRISINDLVVKAAAQAHTAVPGMNVVGTADALRRFSSVDCSVAIATDRGLVAPVLRSVESMSVSSVASATRDLAERARAGTLQQHELEGGSFTVTNLGPYGVEDFAAIINPPQAAILAVGAIRQEAVVDAGTLGVASVMRVTLSVDHRPVDGVVAAEWMAHFLAVIENPLQILA